MQVNRAVAVALVLVLTAIVLVALRMLPVIGANDLELRPNICSDPEHGIIYTDEQCEAASKLLFGMKIIPALLISLFAVMLCCLWEIAYRLYRLWRWKRFARVARIAANGDSTRATADHGGGAVICDPSMIN